MSTVVTIGGAPVSCPKPVTPKRLVTHTRRGLPWFTFEVRGGIMPPGTDPYLGKEITVTINATLRFKGDVVSRNVSFRRGVGWVRVYECRGLLYRANLVPHTDGNNGLDQSTYNQTADNQAGDYRAARAGRTVGQVLTDVLTEPDNAAALDALGLGGYTSLTPPTLPSDTAADLAALAIIPPAPLAFGGEKLGGALESFLSTWAPNHTLHVDPLGHFRFLDTRTYANHTFTLNSDPILPTELSRDCSGSFSRVLVRGQQIAEMYEFGLKWGTLDETPFAHDGLTVAASKAAWTKDDYFKPQSASEGTCVCGSTTSVTVNPDDNAQAWAAGFWDQTSTGKHGYLQLTYAAGATITMIAQRGVTANASLSAGGTSALTLDRALPHTNFDKFSLRGLHGGASSVWREYALPAWAGPKVAPQSTFPFPYRLASGAGETLTSSPMGAVLWSSSGAAPYNEAVAPVSVDPAAGTVMFGYPTFLAAGSRAPDDVRALLPVFTGVNLAPYPADSGGSPVYSGDLHATEAIDRTLTVTVRAWRDPLNLANMVAYAHDLFDSVSDPVIEGEVIYLGLYEAALAPGTAASVAGSGYTLPWATAALPVTECRLDWGTSPGDPMSWTTTLRCSNRRGHFSDEVYLRPDRVGVLFDFAGSLDLSGTTAVPVPSPAGQLAQAAGVASGEIGAAQAATAGAPYEGM